MSTTTTKREYKLSAEPTITNYGAARREILQFAGGDREVIAVVNNDDATDVLDALRKAHEDGREDRNGEDESAKADSWWIATDALARGGEKILGPFATQELALKVRQYVEAVNAPRTYWVDQAEPVTAPSGAEEDHHG